MGKRLTVIVLSIFLLLVSSACGNSESSPDDTESSVQQMQTTKEEPTDETANEPGEEMVSYIGFSPMAIAKKLFGTPEGEELDSWLRDIKAFEFMDKNAKAFEGIRKALQEFKTEGYGLGGKG